MSPKPLLLALLISLPAHAYDLNEAWAAARVHSAQYDAARHARNAAQEPQTQAKARLLPQVSANANYSDRAQDAYDKLAFLLFMSFAAAAQSEGENAVPYKMSNESDLDECENWQEINLDDYLNSSKEQIVKDLRCSIKQLKNKSNYTKNTPIYYTVDNEVYEMSQEDLDYMTEIDKNNYRLLSEIYLHDGRSDPSLLFGPVDIIAKKEERDRSYVTFEPDKFDTYKTGECIKLIAENIEYKINNLIIYSSLTKELLPNKEAILAYTPEWKFYKKKRYIKDYGNIINILRRLNACEIKERFAVSKISITYSIVFKKDIRNIKKLDFHYVENSKLRGGYLVVDWEEGKFYHVYDNANILHVFFDSYL